MEVLSSVRPNRPSLSPSKLEAFTDKAIAFFSPKTAIKRMKYREAFKAFAYNGGQRGSRERQNAYIFPNSSPESSLIQLERIQCIWECRDLSDNFGIADNIYRLYCDYVLGDLHNIRFNTGNKDDDKNLQRKWKTWCRLCDYSNRDNFNQLMRLAKRSQLRDGDVDVRFVEDTIEIGKIKRKMLRIQLIEADRIGSPFNVVVSRSYIGGLILDPETGRVLQHDIYRREPQGSMYVPQAKIDANEVIHFRNLRRADQYRGIPLLAPAIPAYRDLKEILENERIATKVLSSYTMFITSQTGDSTDDPDVYPGVGSAATDPGTGNQNVYKDIGPGSIMYGNPGEEPKMLTPDRPSPAFQGLVKTLFTEIFACAGIGYNFAYEGGDVNGVYARLDSTKTQRTFAQDWRFTSEYLINPTVHRWFQFEEANGYMDDISPETISNRAWENFSFTQPAHPTVDVGRESSANLAELDKSVKSRHTIAAEQGLNWDDEQAQILKEEVILSGGDANRVQNLATSLGDQGVRGIVQLVSSFGQGLIDQATASGTAQVLFGIDKKTADLMFPVDSEKEAPLTLPAPSTEKKATEEFSILDRAKALASSVRAKG